MTEQKKVNYCNAIEDDKGNIIVIKGWYYQDFPSIGKQEIIIIENN